MKHVYWAIWLLFSICGELETGLVLLHYSVDISDHHVRAILTTAAGANCLLFPTYKKVENVCYTYRFSLPKRSINLLNSVPIFICNSFKFTRQIMQLYQMSKSLKKGPPQLKEHLIKITKGCDRSSV